MDKKEGGHMEAKDATVGTRVRTLTDFADVPKGTEGIIDEDYGQGVMVAWDLPDNPLPPGYKFDGKPTFGRPLRDGFGKKTELHFLDVVKGPEDTPAPSK